MTPCHTALPGLRTQHLADHAGGHPVTVCAHDETRLGLLPSIRRRITAGGVQPAGTVTHQFDHCSLYGAGEPTTGEHCFLELPPLNSAPCQRWVAGFGAAVPESFNILVLDNGAFHKAKALQWPANVVPVFFPPSSPELNPIERLWRDRKDTLADVGPQTLEAVSDAVGSVIQGYSDAILPSLTGCTYFVPAGEAARNAYV